jgi:hypothetical protein
LKGANSLSCSFTKKSSIGISNFKSGVNDYQNTIYKFEVIKNILFADVDYQVYFNPSPTNLHNCESNKIIDAAFKYLNSEYYSNFNLHNDQESPKK